MNRAEFERLRSLPDKRITADIWFEASRETSPLLTFQNVAVENSMGLDVLVNGSYNPLIPSLVINFTVRRVGPICRLCVNKHHHGNAGRTHKHELQQPSDSLNNLPQAIGRAELVSRPLPEIWRILCRQANIVHTGRFEIPDRG